MTKDRGKVSYDNRTNQLIVKDTVETVERVKRIIEVLDTQTPQVLIEAKLVEVTEGFTQIFGLRDGLGQNIRYSASRRPQLGETNAEFSLSAIAFWRIFFRT